MDGPEWHPVAAQAGEPVAQEAPLRAAGVGDDPGQPVGHLAAVRAERIRRAPPAAPAATDDDGAEQSEHGEGEPLHTLTSSRVAGPPAAAGASSVPVSKV